MALYRYQAAAQHQPDIAHNWETLYSGDRATSGYIVSNAYSGQQGSGVRALLALQCWMKSFSLPMKIVEPFIENFSLSTYLLQTDLPFATRFSDHFSLDTFNSVSKSEREPTIATWEEFQQHAPRNTVFARIINDCSHDAKPGPFFIEDVTNVNTGSNMNGTRWSKQNGEVCFSKNCLNNHLLGGMNLCVVRIIRMKACLLRYDANRKIYPILFKDRHPIDLTVVFRLWASDWGNMQNPNTLHKLDCRDDNGAMIAHKIQPSPRLLHDARYYTDNFLGRQNRVAVMIRSEQVIRNVKETLDRVEVLQQCLHVTVNLAHKLNNASIDTLNASSLRLKALNSIIANPAHSSNRDRNIFLALDVGKYGSKSIDWILRLKKYHVGKKASGIIHMVENTVRNIYRGQWPYRDWENSFQLATDVTKNPGYIASLQRIVASQADCLVLVGGGDYQRLALVDYQTLHPEPHQQCVFLVCLSRSYVRQYRALLTRKPHVLMKQ